MSRMPAFLKISGQPGAAIDSSFEAYRPLFGVWTIDIIFALRWLEKSPLKSLEETFWPLLKFEWVRWRDGSIPRQGVKGGRSPAKRTLDALDRDVR